MAVFPLATEFSPERMPGPKFWLATLRRTSELPLVKIPPVPSPLAPLLFASQSETRAASSALMP